jgi:hypothetical protein
VKATARTNQGVGEVHVPAVTWKGHDRERGAAYLDREVADHEQPGAVAKCLRDRGRHDQAGEHQAKQQQADGLEIGVEPVRRPHRHEPRVHDREGEDQGLSHAPGIDVAEQVMRKLADGEDVDEIEEELQRRNRPRHFTRTSERERSSRTRLPAPCLGATVRWRQFPTAGGSGSSRPLTGCASCMRRTSGKSSS